MRTLMRSRLRPMITGVARACTLRAAVMIGATLLSAGCSQLKVINLRALTYRDGIWTQKGSSPDRDNGAPAMDSLELAWSAETSANIGHNSMLQWRSALIVSCVTGAVDIFECTTGELIGRIPFKGVMDATPAITSPLAEDALLLLPFSAGENSLECIDLRTGNSLWTKAVGPIAGALMEIGDFIATTRDGRVMRLEERDSTTLVNIRLPAELRCGVSKGDSLIVAADAAGDISGLSYWTGEIKWRVPTGAPILCEPAGSRPYVVAVNTAGRVTCVNASNGVVLWTKELGVPLYNTPAWQRRPIGTGDRADRIFVTCSDGRVIAFASADGAIVWSAQFPTVFSASPLAGVNRIVVAGWDGVLRLLDPDDGHQIWSYRTDAHITSPLIATPGFLFLATDDGRVLAFKRKGMEIEVRQ